MAALRPIGADAQDSTPDAHAPTSDAHESTSDEHEHEHEHEHEPPVPKPRFVPGSFPHEKLDAYRIALQMAALAEKIAASIPRGHRNVADHLERAAANAVLLLSGEADRRGGGGKQDGIAEDRQR